ncbi:hypothetical protein FBY24_1401 [Cellulomonas sp. SLBN-39]|nr:hypothetical protein FBY24_1401 [Cellulomonas sp. SLBN-39]
MREGPTTVGIVRRTLAAASALGAVLTLGACASGLGPDERDACTTIDAWIVGGQDPALVDRSVTQAATDLSASEHDALAAAGDALAGATDADRADLAADVVAACDDLGWEPPEG